MMPEPISDPAILGMIAARSRPAVLKTKLIAFRSSYPNGPILAVEGVDDKVVYSHWIRRLAPQLAFEFFVCDGKRDARSLKNALTRDRGNLHVNVFFFVDRDFDDLEGFSDSEGVFMLDRYSIENYLVDAIVLDACLREAFPCHGEQLIRLEIISLFEHDYSDFLEYARTWNERIFIGRRLGHSIDQKIPKSIAAIATISLGDVKPVDLDPIKEIPLLPKPSLEEEVALKAHFDELNPQTRYRGKFALKFFLEWLSALAREYRTPHLGIFSHLSSSGVKVNHSELSLGGFASRSPLPDGLDKFVLAAVVE